MELTQSEKMMSAVKQQMILHTTRNEYKGTRCNLPVFDEACDLTDEEYDTIREEVYDNAVHSLVEASAEIREVRTLLARAYEQLLLIGYDSGFTN